MSDQSLPKFSWESRKPSHSTFGFRRGGVGLEINLGYVDYGPQICLAALIVVTGQPATIWRSHWVPRASAVSAARDLAADAWGYLGDLRLVVRPVEDLDFSDYVEHIRLRVEGMFQ